MALAVLLGLVLTPGDAYETRVNHSPWWAYEKDLNSIENSYQYYYPYHQQQQLKKDNFRWNYPTRDQVRKKKVDNNRWKYPSSSSNKKKNTFDWNNYLPSVDFNRIKMPTFRPSRKPTTVKPAMSTREWPAYHLLPPIRMIALPMDEPPQP